MQTFEYKGHKVEIVKEDGRKSSEVFIDGKLKGWAFSPSAEQIAKQLIDEQEEAK